MNARSRLSPWRRFRRWWWVTIIGFDEAVFDDHAAGAELGDADMIPLCRCRRRAAEGRPACPGLPTLSRLEELDRQAREGGPAQDAVVRGLMNDLSRDEAARMRARVRRRAIASGGGR